jgi:hypothetical protein
MDLSLLFSRSVCKGRRVKGMLMRHRFINRTLTSPLHTLPPCQDNPLT